MNGSADAALLNTTAGSLGAWLGGFIISMIPGYILLRLAGSPKRKPSTAIILRVLAVLVAAFLAFANYLGGGGQINLGSVFAVVVIVIWAIKQQAARKAA